jgi:hypothetical protein
MPVQVPEKYRFWRQWGEGEKLVLAGGDVEEDMVYDHGVKEAEVRNRGEMASKLLCLWCLGGGVGGEGVLGCLKEGIWLISGFLRRYLDSTRTRLRYS